VTVLAGTVRAPRAYMLFQGQQFVPTSLSVEMSTYRQSDSFSVSLALDATPGFQEDFWASLTTTAVSIFATNDATEGGYVQLFVGNVDDVELDFVSRRVRVRGRDLGSVLLETNTSEQFQNQSVTQIVNTIAQRVGLTANVQVPSNDMQGDVYQTDYSVDTEQDTLMNVLTRLAQRSGCVFWIDGTTLNFVPPDAVTGPTFVVQYQAPTPSSIAQGNFVSLVATRSYRLSRSIKIRTKSWQLKQKNGLISEYMMPGSVTGTLVHDYKAPNLTKQQADAFTQQRLNEISSREKTLTLSLPGDITLTPECPVQLIGTGTEFDQTYIVSRVEHYFEQGSGYRMSVNVRNKDMSRTAQQTSGDNDETSYGTPPTDSDAGTSTGGNSGTDSSPDAGL
jgi:phage protein D